MPTKHVVKRFDAPAYYHIYNRASGERLLYRDEADKAVFLDIIKRHLADNGEDEEGEEYRTYDVELVAYCLMGTHFHLLLYQHAEPEAMTGFMRSVGTGYSMYYNRKYKSKGHVFQSSYRASGVDNQSYLAHITRYIHLNPRHYRGYKWSSYRDYTGRRTNEWVHPERVLDMSPAAYEQFVAEYEHKDRRQQHTEFAQMLN
jgi:REP element-mobilizing transposase RayT